MKIPTFTTQKFVDDRGFLTSDQQRYFDLSNIQLQLCLSDNGFIIPANSTVAINYLASPSNPNRKPDGTMWYDQDTQQYKGKINGVVVVFQTI